MVKRQLETIYRTLRMKGRPILVVFSITLLGLAGAFSFLYNRSGFMEAFESNYIMRAQSLRYYGAMGRTVFLLSRNESLLKGHLEDALKLGLIDFYIIEKSSGERYIRYAEHLSEDALNLLRKPLPFDLHVAIKAAADTAPPDISVDRLTEENLRVFDVVAKDIGDGWILKIGTIRDRAAFLRRFHELYNDRLVMEAFSYTLIAISILIFAMRDIFQMIHSLRSSRPRHLRDISVLSREAQLLRGGLVGLEDQVGNLKAANRVLDAQVLPSLKTEIASGRKPPYTFECTMVRVDINGFTSIFNNYPVDDFIETINDFFHQCSHVISRYQGLIHEFVGDEIIFYFKDSDHSNSLTVALAATNDITLIAEAVHRETTRHHGYPFSVKASVARGTMRFGRLLNGFALAGAPLIETARILSHIVSREGNRIYFESKILPSMSADHRHEESFRTALKGMSGERIIHRYLGRPPFAEVYHSPNRYSLADVIGAYRSDDDLIAMLQIFDLSKPNSRTDEVSGAMDARLNTLLKHIRSFHLTSIGGELLQTLEQILLKASRAALQGKEPGDIRHLSQLVTLLQHFIPVPAATDALIGILTDILHAGLEPRLTANTLETLAHFRSGLLPDVVRGLVFNENNRVAANAVVAVSSSEITSESMARLRRLLDARDPRLLSSALYALGEIVRRHRERDPVYLSAQTEITDLLRKLPGLAEHDNEMVRRQAIWAAEKSGDTDLIAALRRAKLKMVG